MWIPLIFVFAIAGSMAQEIPADQIELGRVLMDLMEEARKMLISPMMQIIGRRNDIMNRWNHSMELEIARMNNLIKNQTELLSDLESERATKLVAHITNLSEVRPCLNITKDYSIDLPKSTECVDKMELDNEVIMTMFKKFSDASEKLMEDYIIQTDNVFQFPDIYNHTHVRIVVDEFIKKAIETYAKIAEMGRESSKYERKFTMIISENRLNLTRNCNPSNEVGGIAESMEKYIKEVRKCMGQQQDTEVTLNKTTFLPDPSKPVESIDLEQTVGNFKQEISKFSAYTESSLSKLKTMKSNTVKKTKQIRDSIKEFETKIADETKKLEQEESRNMENLKKIGINGCMAIEKTYIVNLTETYKCLEKQQKKIVNIDVLGTIADDYIKTLNTSKYKYNKFQSADNLINFVNNRTFMTAFKKDVQIASEIGGVIMRLGMDIIVTATRILLDINRQCDFSREADDIKNDMNYYSEDVLKCMRDRKVVGAISSAAALSEGPRNAGNLTTSISSN